MADLIRISIEQGKVFAKFACCGNIEYQHLDENEKKIVSDSLKSAIDSISGDQKKGLYSKLSSLLKNSLSKETKKSWEEFLSEEESIDEDLDKVAHYFSIELLNDVTFMTPTETLGNSLDKLQNLFKAGRC